MKPSRTGRSRKEKVALAKRRHQVSELYVQGHKQTAIAGHVGVSQQTVSNDLKAIQNEWRNSSVRDFDAVRDKELEKLDRVERESWAAWERSQKPVQSAVVSSGGDRQKTQKTVKEQHGDPRYLEQMSRYHEIRGCFHRHARPAQKSLDQDSPHYSSATVGYRASRLEAR